MSNANHNNTSINIGEIVNRIDVLERSAKEASTDQAKIENYREWIKVGITVPSAVAIAVGLFVQLYNFLDYKNMALELSLSQEIISLNKQLNTQSNPGIIRKAIFLLSTLGPDAAPLLIYQIDNAGTESSIVDAIGFGLKQIIEKNRKGDYIDRERRITELLNIRMQDITNLQLKEDTPSKKSLTDHIEVLTTFKTHRFHHFKQFTR